MKYKLTGCVVADGNDVEILIDDNSLLVYANSKGVLENVINAENQFDASCSITIEIVDDALDLKLYRDGLDLPLEVITEITSVDTSITCKSEQKAAALAENIRRALGELTTAIIDELNPTEVPDDKRLGDFEFYVEVADK